MDDDNVECVSPRQRRPQYIPPTHRSSSSRFKTARDRALKHPDDIEDEDCAAGENSGHLLLHM